MKHLTKPTRSFVFLIVVVLVTAYGALILARHQKDSIPNLEVKTHGLSANAGQNKPEPTLVSTQGWNNYDDQTYPLQFKYPATWKATPDKTMPGYYAVNLTTDQDRGIVKVYVSSQDYFALNGLQTQPYSINGMNGQTLDDWIYALKAGDYYYTFDSTEASKPLPELRTIVSTANFK